ncbi:MAG: glycerophosphodiester phosphodiesterase family protein, partial [Gammaproteobacteria bacterium]
MIPVLVAHRGYMEKYPENSLSSIEAALQAGACMVEFDVQMDANGQLLLLHDDNFKRTAGIDSS